MSIVSNNEYEYNTFMKSARWLSFSTFIKVGGKHQWPYGNTPHAWLWSTKQKVRPWFRLASNHRLPNSYYKGWSHVVLVSVVFRHSKMPLTRTTHTETPSPNLRNCYLEKDLWLLVPFLRPLPVRNNVQPLVGNSFLRLCTYLPIDYQIIQTKGNPARSKFSVWNSLLLNMDTSFKTNTFSVVS